MTKVIGLTGGIASGKSTVSKLLKEMGAIIIDADLIARDIVGKGSEALKEIVDRFGEKVLKEDGSLDRKALANIVFNDTEKLRILNEITHPRIIGKIKDLINFFSQRGEKIVIIDAALLIESNLHKIVDEVWLVYLDKNLQIERLMARDNISFLDALKRIESQMPIEEKLPYADKVIDNSRSLEELKEKVEELYREAMEVFP